jgi:hypothetical protein
MHTVMQGGCSQAPWMVGGSARTAVHIRDTRH